MGVREDAAQWAWEKRQAHAQAHAQAIDVFPALAGPRLKAVLDAEARASKSGKPLDFRHATRGAVSPLAGTVSEAGYGQGYPRVAKHLLRK